MKPCENNLVHLCYNVLSMTYNQSAQITQHQTAGSMWKYEFRQGCDECFITRCAGPSLREGMKDVWEDIYYSARGVWCGPQITFSKVSGKFCKTPMKAVEKGIRELQSQTVEQHLGGWSKWETFCLLFIKYCCGAEWDNYCVSESQRCDGRLPGVAGAVTTRLQDRSGERKETQ